MTDDQTVATVEAAYPVTDDLKRLMNGDVPHGSRWVQIAVACVSATIVVAVVGLVFALFVIVGKNDELAGELDCRGVSSAEQAASQGKALDYAVRQSSLLTDALVAVGQGDTAPGGALEVALDQLGLLSEGQLDTDGDGRLDNEVSEQAILDALAATAAARVDSLVTCNK